LAGVRNVVGRDKVFDGIRVLVTFSPTSCVPKVHDVRQFILGALHVLVVRWLLRGILVVMVGSGLPIEPSFLLPEVL